MSKIGRVAADHGRAVGLHGAAKARCRRRTNRRQHHRQHRYGDDRHGCSHSSDLAHHAPLFCAGADPSA
ncbi:MAG: hypothetical protein AAFY28_18585, partial [Actinomycetota bacterium]